MNLKNTLALVFLLLISSWCFASGENAILVVNAESASSKLVANFYIHKRRIPHANVVYLSGIPKQEMVRVQDFREKVLLPILKVITQRKLSDHIDYIIYSSDFPTIIDARTDRAKLLNSANNSQYAANSKFLSPYVSINSATYFFQKIVDNDPSYLSLEANNYMRAEGTSLLANPFLDEDGRIFERALRKTRTDNFDEAIKLLEGLADKHRLQLAVLYWLARAYAWQGDAENAGKWLKRSISVGWCYQDYTKSDSAFQRIMSDADFRSVVELIPALPFHHGPTQGFRSIYNWGLNGMINSTSDQGDRYVLSTILAVNRNRGTSEQETLDYLQHSINADGSRPQGTFYFTKTGNVRTKTRDKGVAEAIEELRALGQECQLVNQRIPMGRNDILGCTVGTAKFDWMNSRNTIIPGAICENLTSYGGRFMLDKKQTLLSEFLRHGAAGSSGTVVEPYAIQAKFPHPRIQVHYARGCTLAESFYQSVAGPFQLLIVGDALCRPWARIPELKLTGEILSDREISGELKFGISVADSSAPVRQVEMYLGNRLLYRIERANLGTITVDTNTMPDGYHEFRFVGIAADTIGSRGSLIAPIMVNNRDLEVSLATESVSARIDDEISFEVNAVGAAEIRLTFNGQILAISEEESGRFSIPAYQFGRGRVAVQASAKFDDQFVFSRPLELEIRGPISTRIPEVRMVPPQKKKKPTANKATAPANKTLETSEKSDK